MNFSFELKYTGGTADNNVIDMFDGGRALAGFHRTLALTTNLLVNGEVITQAPALQNAEIYLQPIEAGSWKATALISIVMGLGVASTDSLFGWLLESSVGYVFEESLGEDFGFDQGKLQDQLKSQKTTSGKNLDISRLDSVIEKCENSIKDVHRPIVNSATAENAQVACLNPMHVSSLPITLNKGTYEFISTTIKSDVPKYYRVKISGFNINTKRGRLYSPDLGVRTIPFILHSNAQTITNESRIIESMSLIARDQSDDRGFIIVRCLRSESQSGRLKSLTIVQTMTENEYEQLQRVLN